MASSSEHGSKAEGESTEPPLTLISSADENLLRGLKKVRRERGSTAKERISQMPPCAAGKRSSIYRGVTRHRWTGRYEAHLWDKGTWNQNQNKKGKQVYLGAYDDEEAAARAYDLAALKYWGPGTLINFPVSDYTRDVEEMQTVSREDYLASLRRKSSGFSRGVSKYRGISRQSQNSRWGASFGRILGNEFITSRNCSTSEDAAAESEYGSSFGVARKIDLTSYIAWWGPNKIRRSESHSILKESKALEWPSQPTEPYQLPSLGFSNRGKPYSSVSAFSILSQSAHFKGMQERAVEARNKMRGNENIYEKTVPKLINGGGRNKEVGDGSGLSDLALQRMPYPFTPLLTAPLTTHCGTVDPFPDPIFWTSLVPAPGLSLTPTLKKNDLSSGCTFYGQD